MPKVKWTDGKPSTVRIIGPYQWAQENKFTCEVAAEDVPGIITLPGFDLDEASDDVDDLARIRGIGQKWVDELTLAGIVSFRQLAEVDAEALTEKIGARWAMVQAWQGQALELVEECTNVDDIQAEDEAPHG